MKKQESPGLAVGSTSTMDVAGMPVGTVVRDRREHVWVRRPRGWQGVGRGGYTTSADLTALGPLVHLVEAS